MKQHIHENELLLLCARSQIDRPSVKQVRFLAENKEFDWEVLFQAAVYHRVVPLLYCSLQNCCLDLVPDHILKRLRSFYLENGTRNVFIAGILLLVLKNFKKHHIHAVPFKGPLLTATVFGDLSLRTFGDLDILIAPQDMELAVHLLLEQGYTLNFDLPLDKYLKLVRKGHHANLIHPKNGLVVELHWEMSGRYFIRNFDFNYVRARLESVLLLDQPLISLGTEDLLLYLCIHGNRHRWIQLDAVCCLAELIRARPSINWELAIKLAREFGAARMFLLGLELARRLLGSRLPSAVLKLIEEEKVLVPLSTRIERGLWSPKRNQGEVKYHLDGLNLHYRTMDRLSDVIMYTLRKFCTLDGYDIQWAPLPMQLWFFYSALRPLRFAVDIVQKFTQKNNIKDSGCRAL